MLALLARLLPAPRRHFVLLDAQQRCRALRSCRQIPVGGHWVEVREASPAWLGRPLPDEARLPRHVARPLGQLAWR